MSSNERLSPKPQTRGTARRTGVNPVPINTTTQSQSIRDTQYRPRYTDEEDLLMEDDPDASNPPRPPSSAVRLNKPAAGQIRRTSRDVSPEIQTRRTTTTSYGPATSQRRSTQNQAPGAALPAQMRPTRNTTAPYDEPPVRKERRSVHWMLYVGLGMIAILALWELGATALSWGTNEYNNIMYGYPRTSQIDAVVGHNDSIKTPSHFLAVNLHGQVIIFELPGGDPSKAIDYTGPDLVGPGDDQIPITLSFSDANHDGKLDMIVHIADKEIIFYNNGTKFVSQPPASNS